MQIHLFGVISMKKKIISLLFSLILIFTIIIISIKFIKNNESLISKKTDSSKANSTDYIIHDSTQSPVSESDIDKLTYKIGEMCQTQNYSYKLNNIYVSKECVGLTPWINGYYSVDDQGTLKDNHSYLIVDISICNLENSSQELYMNLISIFASDYDDPLKNLLREAYIFNSSQIPPDDKDFFKYNFNPNESVDFKIAYVISDELINYGYDLLQLRINPNGMGHDDDTRIYNIIENGSIGDIKNEDNNKD